MNFLKGINATSGIIPVPAYDTRYDMDSLSMVRKPIDQYARLEPGNPKNNRRKYSSLVIPKVGSLIGKHKLTAPTYNHISNDNTMHINGNEHHITIEDYRVSIDGIFLISAPGHFKPAPALRFCKAVIESMLTDEENFKDQCIKIGISLTVVFVPEVLDTIIESITGSMYPGLGVLENLVKYTTEYEYALSQKELSMDLEELGEYDPADETGDNPVQESYELSEYWPDVMKEVCKNDKPAGWIAHLRLSIVEVPA